MERLRELRQGYRQQHLQGMEALRVHEEQSQIIAELRVEQQTKPRLS